MALALEFAEIFIQNKLQTLAMTHLYVRTQSRSLIIYSIERDGETTRAILTQLLGHEFALSISNHRGKWQLIPLVGPLSEMMNLLTEDLTFVLARWFDNGTNNAFTSFFFHSM